MVILNLTNDELIIPGDWMSIFQTIQSQDGTVMVLGKNDSGKTSFIKLLTYYLVKRNRKICLIDADIGQSNLGPPGTIGMGIVDQKRLKDGIIPVDYILFIGALSPEQCIDRFISRVYQIYTIAQKEKVDTILIDTTGLVLGKVGVYLKSNLIKKVNPTVLVAIQFDKELEPILLEGEFAPSVQVYRIKPYPYIVGKNWSERKIRRKRQFSLYFQGSQWREIDFSEITIKDFNYGLEFCPDGGLTDLFRREFQLEIFSAEVINDKVFVVLLRPQKISPECNLSQIKIHFGVKQIIFIQPQWFGNLLFSLNNSEGLSIGLGIIKNIDWERMRITAYFPISVTFDNLAQIELGRVRIKPDGSELSYLEPERY